MLENIEYLNYLNEKVRNIDLRERDWIIWMCNVEEIWKWSLLIYDFLGGKIIQADMKVK